MRRKDVTTSEASTWCADHKSEAPPDMLNDQNEHVCAEKCPLTTRHTAEAAVAAEEQEC